MSEDRAREILALAANYEGDPLTDELREAAIGWEAAEARVAALTQVAEAARPAVRLIRMLAQLLGAYGKAITSQDAEKFAEDLESALAALDGLVGLHEERE